MAKSAEAFRTISEVADWLGLQTHVLRFWESKFSQVRPVKRAGGRRYYRPSDMLLLGGIRKLLHDDGLTIKGVQKILREEGVAFVADLSKPLDDLTAAQIDDALHPKSDEPVNLLAPDPEDAEPVATPATEEAVEAEPAQVFEPSATEAGAPEEDAPPLAASAEAPAAETPPVEPAPIDTGAGLFSAEEAPIQTAPEQDFQPAAQDAEPEVLEPSITESVPEEPEPSEHIAAEPEPVEPASFVAEPEPAAPAPFVAEPEPAEPASFVAEPEPVAPEAAEVDTPAPKPLIVDAPDGPALEDIPAEAGVLTRIATRVKISPEHHSALVPLAEQLAALREKMASAGRSGS